MSDVRAATADLLAEKPELEPAIQELLALDETGEWAFDEAPVDSGVFGEIVERDLARRTDSGGYRLTDPAAISTALESPDGDAESDPSDSAWFVRNLRTTVRTAVDRQTATLVSAALALVMLVRVGFAYPGVVRDGDIVFLGNDPWFYRYWVAQLLSAEGLSFRPAGFSALPDVVATHDVGTIVLYWGIGELFGTPYWVDVAMAVVPVLAAVLCGLGVYAIGATVSGDRRVGLAAVVMLALTPIHALRTALGFADHHAVDYVWVVLIALSLVVFVTCDTERSTRHELAAVVGLGVGVAASVLSWRGGPLLILPIAVYAPLKLFVDAGRGRRPGRTNRGLFAGLVIATVLAAIPHATFGWTQTYRALAPALLLAGTVGALGVATAVHRYDWDPRFAGVGTLLALCAVFGVFWVAVPQSQQPLLRFFELFQFGSDNIAEKTSILSGSHGSVAAPLLFFGIVLYLALPYMGWLSIRVIRGGKTVWLPVLTYGWFFFVLSVFQIRFGGPLSLFTAVFSGLGFVHLAATIDLAAKPVPLGGTQSSSPLNGVWQTLSAPDWQTIVYMALLLVLVSGIGLFQTGIKITQGLTDDASYTAAKEIEAYTERHGMTYPDTLVLSRWGDNRMYNYLVNGEIEGHQYAQYNYGEFINSQSVTEWQVEFLDEPVGFVVIQNQDFGQGTLGDRLYNTHGSRSGETPGLANYRLIHAGDGTKVFAVVDGATVSTEAAPGRRLTVSTNVTVKDIQFRYERRVQANESGVAAVRVPYPGTYRVGNETVVVTESAVDSY